MNNKYSAIQNTKANIDTDSANWLTKEFAFPWRTIRLATSFSGIGAIEQALIRLGIDYDIAFACDNGDIELNLLEGDELEEYIIGVVGAEMPASFNKEALTSAQYMLEQYEYEKDSENVIK